LLWLSRCSFGRQAGQLLVVLCEAIDYMGAIILSFMSQVYHFLQLLHFEACTLSPSRFDLTSQITQLTVLRLD
jgi:hypothetical protein